GAQVDGINDVGQIVGTNHDGHAVVYSGGLVTDLGTFGASAAEILAITNSGKMAGLTYTNETNGRTISIHFHGFSYVNGVKTDLPTFGGPDNKALAINDAGTVVGLATAADGGAHAFRFDGAT